MEYPGFRTPSLLCETMFLSLFVGGAAKSPQLELGLAVSHLLQHHWDYSVQERVARLVWRYSQAASGFPSRPSRSAIRPHFVAFGWCKESEVAPLAEAAVPQMTKATLPVMFQQTARIEVTDGKPVMKVLGASAEWRLHKEPGRAPGVVSAMHTIF
jgi:hypothetical protein